MMFSQGRPPPSDTTGSTADEENEREGADHQDTHSLGQLVLLGVILDHLLDRLNGLAGRILEDVPHGAHGSVGLDRRNLQQMSQQRKHVNSIDLRFGIFWALNTLNKGPSSSLVDYLEMLYVWTVEDEE